MFVFLLTWGLDILFWVLLPALDISCHSILLVLVWLVPNTAGGFLDSLVYLLLAAKVRRQITRSVLHFVCWMFLFGISPFLVPFLIAYWVVAFVCNIMKPKHSSAFSSSGSRSTSYKETNLLLSISPQAVPESPPSYRKRIVSTFRSIFFAIEEPPLYY